jgi:hypothetical protein
VGARLAEVAEGGRNTALNRAAFELGTLACVAPLGRDEVHEALRVACVANGLMTDEGNGGEAGFEATFDSGWNAGLRTGERE